MSGRTKFRGLTYFGSPMQFVGPRPTKDGIVLAALLPEQVVGLQRLGIEIHILMPDEDDGRQFYLAPYAKSKED